MSTPDKGAPTPAGSGDVAREEARKVAEAIFLYQGTLGHLNVPNMTERILVAIDRATASLREERDEAWRVLRELHDLFESAGVLDENHGFLKGQRRLTEKESVEKLIARIAQLERDLKEQTDSHAQTVGVCHDALKERDQLRADNARLTAELEQARAKRMQYERFWREATDNNEFLQRDNHVLRQRIAELEADKRCMDWLEKMARNYRDRLSLIASEAPATTPGWTYFVEREQGPNLRAAVRKAMEANP